MIAISIPGRSRVLFCFHAFGFLHDCIQSITSPLSHLSPPLLLLLYCQQLHNVLVLHLLQHLRSGQQEFSTCTHCKMVLIGTDLELPHLNLLRSHVWQLVECLHLKCKSHVPRYNVHSSCILSDLDCLVKSECCESLSPDINSISHRNSLSIVLVHSLEYCSCRALAQHAAKYRISSKIQEKRHPISSNEAQNIGLSYHSLTFPTDLPRCAPHIVSWPSEERHAVPQFLLRSFISFCAPTYFPQAGCFSCCFELLTDQPLYFNFPTLC